MNRAWLWVLAGGVAETAWASFMKLSDGFSNLGYDVLTVVFLAISLYFLNRGFRAGLPTGPCYAVWTGIGAVGSVLVGILWLGDTLNILGWVFLAILLVGVIGMNLAPDAPSKERVTSRGRIRPGRL